MLDFEPNASMNIMLEINYVNWGFHDRVLS